MNARLLLLRCSACILAAASATGFVSATGAREPFTSARPSQGGVPAGDPSEQEVGIASARAALESARQARAAGELDVARERVSAAIDLALPVLARHREPIHLCLCEIGHFAHELGATREAERFRRANLELAERTLPADDPELLAAQQYVAITLYQLGDLGGARALFERVLEARERTLAGDHALLISARENLAIVIQVLGDLQGARELFEDVLEARERVLPEHHPHLARARTNLAVTLRALGDLQGARALDERVVEALERGLPEEDPRLLSARENLALTMRDLGDLEGARAVQERVLQARERTLLEDHRDLLRAVANLAGTMLELGELQVACALQERALTGLERTLPEDHPDVLAMRANVAETLYRLRDLHGARLLRERVLEALERTLPEDHPNLQRARRAMALTLKEMGSLPAARELEERVLEVLERTLPDEHPDLLAARMGLAGTMFGLGDLQAARSLGERALAGLEGALAEDHPQLLRARSNLAVTLFRLGDLAGAREHLQRVAEIRERTLPADHPELLVAWSHLATSSKAQGDYQHARLLEERVLEALERTLPEDHPDLLRARHNFALSLRKLGDVRGACAHLERVLAGRERILPEDHPELLLARRNLAVGCLDLALGSVARTGESREPGPVVGPETDWGWSRAFELVVDVSNSARRTTRGLLLESSSREAEERAAQVIEMPLSLALSLAQGYGRFEPAEELALAGFALSETGRGAGLSSVSLARAARSSAEYGRLRELARTARAELASLAQEGGSPEAFHAARTRRERAERELAGLATDLLGEGFAGLWVDASTLAARLRSGEVLVAFRRYTRWWLEEPEDGAKAEQPEGRERGLESLGAFVLARGEAGSEPKLAFVDLGSIEAIDLAVRDWRATIGVGTTAHVRSGSGQESGPRGIGLDAPASSSGATEARALRRLVWDPLVSALGTAQRVSVALDDMLHLVPLEALHLEEEERLLGERWRIETRTSFWELLAEDPPVDPSGALVALGDVAYDAEPVAWGEDQGEQEPDTEMRLLAQASGETRPSHQGGGYAGVLRGSPSEGGFASLSQTGPEVRSIAKLLRDSVGLDAQAILLEGPRASLASLEALAPKTRWLHLATHGWFAPDRIRSFADRDEGADSSRAGLALRTDTAETVGGMSPLLLCGLALAGANLAPDFLGRVPGLLTAEELSGLDLTNCELAVLSACDTNVGRLSRAGQGVASLQKALHMAGARSVITSLWKVDDAATAKFFERFYTRLWHEGLPKSEALWRTKLELRAEGHPLRDWAAWVLTGDPN